MKTREPHQHHSAGKLQINFNMLLVSILVLIALVALLAPRDWWLTADQQAQRLSDRGEFEAAATLFSSSQRRGEALYRAGEFEAAANAFARINSAEGYFNRGNALLMGGKYEDAIKAYDQAIDLRPNWSKVRNNLEIAQLRAERVRREGGDSTGGKLEADEIVFDAEPGGNQGEGTEQVEDEQRMSDQELQALWLRRVQTKPADFLRAKFSFQLISQESDGD